MKYIDLTLQVGKTNKIYKLAEMQLKKEIVMGHVGTHIDVYDRPHIPLEYIQTRGVIFDVSYIKDREITSDDVDLDYVRPGDCVLFRTGNIERHPYGSGLYFSEGPQFAWELIEELVENNICFIGVDAADLRRGQEHVEVDKYCERKGVYIIENLTQLDKIDPFKVCKVMTMWHENPEATGIKCRVVAVQPKKNDKK